jgi:hypothetical protein
MASIGCWCARLGRVTVTVMALATAVPVVADPLAVEGAILWPGPAETRADQIDAYNAAVRAAAIKRPGFARALTPIDTGEPRVRVVALRWIGASDVTDARGRLTSSLFVALPRELKAACKGAAEPVLALQQILGLPPRTGEYVMVEFGVPTTRVFRPCASGPDVTATSCAFALPAPATAARAKADDALAETQAFVFRQMWASYTFNVPTKESFGYPFTGMGWTYDWNPDADDTFGVSEYVAKLGAQTFRLRKIEPAAFCG